MKALDKEILRLAVPSILANITVPLVGMVDVAVAGHLEGGLGALVFIGSISVGSLLFDLLYWNFGFLRASTGGLVAQAYGRHDYGECIAVFMRSLALSIIFSLIILLLQWPFQQLAFAFVKPSADVHSLALSYFKIRIWAAPATLSLMVFRGWFVGMQDSLSSMATDLVVNMVNIVASVTLTLGAGSWEGLGFSGIALGTLIAQYSGLLAAILLVITRHRQVLRQGAEGFKTENIVQKGALSRLFSMNADIFVRSLCFISIYVGFTTISARYGDAALSAGTILMKILMLFSYFTDGFAYAGEALTGRFIGAGRTYMLRMTVRKVFAWSLSMAVVFVTLYATLGEWMVGVMSSDPMVVQACRPYLWWLLLMPPLGCAAFTWDGIYEGATATRDVRNAMLLAALSFFGLWFCLLPFCSTDGGAMNCLLAAYFAHLLARTVYLTCRWKYPL